MQKRRRKAVIFVWIILAVCLTGGCGSEMPEDGEKKSITLLASQNWIKEIDRQLFRKFEEQTGTEVRLLLTPDDGYETLLGMCLSGGNSAVDVFMFPSGTSMEAMGMEDIALDLSQEEWVSRLEDWAFEAVSCKGKVLGQNIWGEDYEGILYNRTFFQEHHLEVPDTWEGFLTLCEKIRRLGTAPLYENLNSSWHIISWAYGLTPVMECENPGFREELNRNPGFGLADLECFSAGLYQFQQMIAAQENGIPKYYTDGGQDEDFKGSYRVLAERKAVMLFTYSAYAKELEEYGSRDEWGMFPVPLLDNRTAVSNGGGIAKFINKHSQNIAECRQLFDFLAEEENLEAYYEARTDLVTAAFSGVRSVRAAEATKEILERSERTPCVIFTKEVRHIDPDLYKYMQGLIDGTCSVEQLVSRCDQYREEMFGDGTE